MNDSKIMESNINGNSPIRCLGCEAPYPQLGFPHLCPECGGLYDFAEPLKYTTPSQSDTRSLWRYRETFPLQAQVKSVSLGEGNTPLVPYDLKGKQVFFKCEYLNPTGSFKDRGTTILVSAISSQKINRAVDDSSGNAGASLAAYAARAGMEARIFIPAYASGPKRKQMEAYGAELESIPGPRSAASEAVREAVAGGETYASHAHLPHGIAGMATTAFEIFEQLGRPPGSVITPVGQGTLLIGLGRGFRALLEAGLIRTLPKLIAVQAKACAPVWKKFTEGQSSLEEIAEGETIAEGIRIKAPVRLDAVLEEIERSNGMVVAVDEDVIKDGRVALARLGLYVEPTSSVVWPALDQTMGRLEQPIVAILTGSGLKSA